MIRNLRKGLDFSRRVQAAARQNGEKRGESLSPLAGITRSKHPESAATTTKLPDIRDNDAFHPAPMATLRQVTLHPHLMPTLSLPLHPHPNTPCPEVASITIAAALEGATALDLHFRLEGRIDQLRIPPPQLSGHADNLWEHTCFEAFLTRSDLAIYHELNFSPSGQWARYAFSAYRQRAGIPAGLPPPEFSVCLSPERLELHILIATAGFPEAAPDSCWQLGISAVIENRQGDHAYWALSHAGPTPDFHQRTTFLLNLK